MDNSFQKLTSFLERLKQAKIHYALTDVRAGAIMVEVAIPGERWEIEFFGDAHVEVEIFKVSGYMQDESVLEELFTRFSD